MAMLHPQYTENPSQTMHLFHRPRRLRKSATIRNQTQETWLRTADLIQPLFVVDGQGAPEPIASMPGIQRWSMKDVVSAAGRVYELGIPAIALFPSIDPGLKNDSGTEASNPDTLVLRAIRAIKRDLPELAIIADVALDPYTTHGHDGLLNESGTEVLNDPTVERLAEMALLLADAGADWVAPSDMMDGRIGAIREALEDHGFVNTCILSYAAKYASAYYGPFRDAVGSSKAAGTHHLDKRGYQMNPANVREALTEVALDIEEGADAVMVKPAGPYLDIIRAVRESCTLPVAAYQVSGEYAQIHAAAQMGWLDLEKCRYESLLAIKRAGADMILSYFSEAIAPGLR
jgi:porphobilinogen synthase